jgi:hypothetical protein
LVCRYFYQDLVQILIKRNLKIDVGVNLSNALY